MYVRRCMIKRKKNILILAGQKKEQISNLLLRSWSKSCFLFRRCTYSLINIKINCKMLLLTLPSSGQKVKSPKQCQQLCQQGRKNFKKIIFCSYFATFLPGLRCLINFFHKLYQVYFFYFDNY